MQYFKNTLHLSKHHWKTRTLKKAGN